MSLELRIPGLRDMAARQAWLGDPATMAHNRGRDLGGAKGYDPETGCIDFPRENWRWWRQIWLYNEPDFYSAFIFSDGIPVGEVCWFREGEDYSAGILIAAEHRGKGHSAAAIRLLTDHAFSREEIPALKCAFPSGNVPARSGFLRAGFHIQREGEGVTEMLITREEWERGRG